LTARPWLGRGAGRHPAVRSWALVIGLLAVVAVGCGGSDKRSPQRAKADRRPAASLAPGRLVAIGGDRSLYLYCVGSGTPTVVFEAGLGGASDAWRDVQPQLGRVTRTCAYDRAGLGNSVARAGVHDAADEIDDLHRLLDRARIAPPYVLVGHSYGGLLARLFAHAYAGQTAGVVLVDAMGRDQTRRQLALWPESQAPARRRQWATPVIDGLDLRSSEALGRRVRTLGSTPLVVITAGQPDAAWTGLPRRLVRAQERLRARMQDELARLSPDHVHVVALRSGHFVQRLDGQPDAVITAVSAVVEAARHHTGLPPCPRLFSGPDVRCRL
jgi:pimeloyl-ACP methyl ester carboxylesterase